MAVFIATSKRFYPEAKRLVSKLRAAGVRVHHPYFDLDSDAVDSDPDVKREVTLRHFPEIDACDVLYALTPDGYAGSSVTIELTYAYARGKRIIASELPAEFALRAIVAEICPPSDLHAHLQGGHCLTSG
jgi:hypothetical protein